MGRDAMWTVCTFCQLDEHAACHRNGCTCRECWEAEMLADGLVSPFLRDEGATR